jgi:DNA-binding transcriptional regulator YdaS (Cro superfamily)
MDTPMTPQEAFNEALRRAGSQAALATIVGKRQPAISKRLRGTCRAEPTEAIAIERETGVPRAALCPEVFNPDPTSSVLPGSEVVEGGAPIVPGDRRAKMQCVKS